MSELSNQEMQTPEENENLKANAPIPHSERGKKRKKLSKSNQKKRKRAIALQIQLTALLLVVVFLIGWMIPLRPSVSELEKRQLTKFPKLTLTGIMDGSFFSGVELWYADTFPMREGLLSLNSKLNALFGLKNEQFIGELPIGDEIPKVDIQNGNFDWMQLPTAGSTSDASPVVDTPVTTAIDGEGQGTTHPPVTQQTPVTAGSPVGNEPTDEPVPEKSGSVYLLNDTAYELYGFSQAQTDRYIRMVNELADQLKGQSTVYSVIAPLAYGIQLSDTVQKKMGATDENEALIYIYSQLNDQVKKVYAFNNLMAHKDEYLYYRTDHHWTALGAYYAYEMFCAQKGIAPTPLSFYKEHTFEGFLGSLYATCGSPASMAQHPDMVVAYEPFSTNRMTCYQKDGTVLNWYVIADVDSWGAGSKYSTFIGGDNPYSEIHNPNLNDGSSCVVVKNSYGCAFVPFLVDQYEDVYVVDFRYFDKWSNSYNGGQSFKQLIADKQIQDVLIVTNIIATGAKELLDPMETMFQK